MTLSLDLAIRSAILVLLGLAVVAVLRRQPAALRHAVLAMTIIATAALLPLKAIVPAWQVPLPMFVAPQLAVPQPWGASLPVSDASQITAPPASITTGPRGIVGSAAAGRPVAFNDCGVYCFDDAGKLRSERIYLDTDNLLPEPIFRP